MINKERGVHEKRGKKTPNEDEAIHFFKIDHYVTTTTKQIELHSYWYAHQNLNDYRK